MQNYEYDPATGELIRISEAAPSPGNPGQVPDRVSSTHHAPPEAGENEKAVWNGVSWELKPDFRGKRYYRRDSEGLIEGVVIHQLGEKVPADAYIRFEDVPLSPSEKVQRLSAEVAALLHRVSGGPEYDYMSITDAKSYVQSQDPDQALEARAFVLWDKACWDVFHSLTSDADNLPATIALLDAMPEFDVPFV